MELYSVIYYLLKAFMALLGLSVLVAVHEFGHFIFAKLFGVYVPSFSIGFGPKILSKKIGETEFCLSAIPLGGYVEIAGNAEIGQGDQQYSHLSANDHRSFAGKPYWQKMLIMFGGILFNFILAFSILSGLYFSGAPCIGQLCSSDAPIIKKVEQDSNAFKAGMQAGDRILSIDENPINTIQNFKAQTNNLIDKEVAAKILRNNEEKNINILIGFQEVSGKKLPKIGIEWQSQPRSFSQSIYDGLYTTWSITKDIFEALKNLVTGKMKDRSQIGGPLLLLYQIAESLSQGYKVFLFLLAAISINLAVFNILPLPIFDGGQALFYTIEAITGRPLSESTREKIGQYTWLFVIGLIILLTFSDITKIFKK